MARSTERQAEIVAMDRIEKAMGGIDGLAPAAQVRVRRWVAETWPNSGAYTGALASLADLGITGGTVPPETIGGDTQS